MVEVNVKLIRDRRGELGLTQEAAASQSGVSVGTWREIESGSDRQRRPTTWNAVAETLGVSPDELFHDPPADRIEVVEVPSARRSWIIAGALVGIGLIVAAIIIGGAIRDRAADEVQTLDQSDLSAFADSAFNVDDSVAEVPCAAVALVDPTACDTRVGTWPCGDIIDLAQLAGIGDDFGEWCQPGRVVRIIEAFEEEADGPESRDLYRDFVDDLTVTLDEFAARGSMESFLENQNRTEDFAVLNLTGRDIAPLLLQPGGYDEAIRLMAEGLHDAIGGRYTVDEIAAAIDLRIQWEAAELIEAEFPDISLGSRFGATMALIDFYRYTEPVLLERFAAAIASGDPALAELGQRGLAIAVEMSDPALLEERIVAMNEIDREIVAIRTGL